MKEKRWILFQDISAKLNASSLDHGLYSGQIPFTNHYAKLVDNLSCE